MRSTCPCDEPLPECSYSHSHSHSHSGKTYFSLLPTDVLLRVATLLERSCATARSGGNFLFDPYSPFARVARNYFTSLSIWTRRAFQYSLTAKRVEFDGVTSGSNIDFVSNYTESDFGFLLGECMDAVRRLEVRHVKADDTGRFKKTLGYVFRRLGAQLTEVYFRRYYFGTFVPPELLTKWASACPRLRSLEYDGIHFEVLLGLVREVSHTLEEVSLKTLDASHWPDTLHCLRAHCSNLCVISLHNPIENPRVGEDDFVQFLSSFNSRLKYIYLPRLSSDACERIMRNCEHARVRYLEKCHEFDCVSTVASRLEHLTLNLDDFRPALIDSLKCAMAKCDSLNVLHIKKSEKTTPAPLAVEVGFAVFTTPFANLHELVLPRIAEPMRVLDKVAALTGNLKSITIACTESENAAVFSELIRLNTRLKCATVRVHEDETYDLAAFEMLQVGLFRVFARCESLERLVIEFLAHKPPDDLIRDLGVPFRRRDVDLRVSWLNRGTRYNADLSDGDGGVDGVDGGGDAQLDIAHVETVDDSDEEDIMLRLWAGLMHASEECEDENEGTATDENRTDDSSDSDSGTTVNFSEESWDWD